MGLREMSQEADELNGEKSYMERWISREMNHREK
jgi:hypothetical protein